MVIVADRGTDPRHRHLSARVRGQMRRLWHRVTPAPIRDPVCLGVTGAGRWGGTTVPLRMLPGVVPLLGHRP